VDFARRLSSASLRWLFQLRLEWPTGEIISKLEHGHTESQTVALLGLMEELGWDYNDLRERKAVNDARLAAGKYVYNSRLMRFFVGTKPSIRGRSARETTSGSTDDLRQSEHSKPANSKRICSTWLWVKCVSLPCVQIE
jgi:hypothetical protein